MSSSFFNKYLLPGFIFQSLIIGGGYGTGRELVEFFLSEGPVYGLINMGIATVIWSVVLAICFEFSRIGKHYEYRSFLKDLLGKLWIGYEYLYLVGLVLVVSVMGSASGEIFSEMFQVKEIVGVVIMMLLVGLIVFYGTSLIEKLLSIWSIILYAAFIIMFIAVFNMFSTEISSTFSLQQKGNSLAIGGIKYAAYNIGLAPAILFCVRHLETRKEAILSGVFAGVIGMVPALIMFLAMLSQYPLIISESVPVNLILDKIGWNYFKIIFQVVLFGTFIETGVSLIHGFNERILSVNQNLKDHWRALIGVALLIGSIFIANAVGLIGLIAKGYGAITWGYWIIFVIPILTIGAKRIFKNG
ncbi:MAG: hypothetical protein VX517_00350 [Candidatus Neomarinimicrobiota bacterium]|jgi:uncharacterized membrane protein YkvI|nr:hypothetical protein [Candidatus Neomarinimicrobiota bacterium]|tara:strand:+ start:1833 stop:2906 length:1074 start_codon:yes stop_codon:yes gene_type:complete